MPNPDAAASQSSNALYQTVRALSPLTYPILITTQVIKHIRSLKSKKRTLLVASLRALRLKVIALPLETQRCIQIDFNPIWARMVAVNIYTDQGFEDTTISELLEGKGSRQLALDDAGRTLGKRLRFGFWDLDPTPVDEDEAVCTHYDGIDGMLTGG